MNTATAERLLPQMLEAAAEERGLLGDLIADPIVLEVVEVYARKRVDFYMALMMWNYERKNQK